jgi:hypothetical protein
MVERAREKSNTLPSEPSTHSDAIFEGARSSIEVVCFLRKLARSNELLAHLQKNNISDPVMKCTVFQCKHYCIVNEKETVKEYELQRPDVKDLIEEFHDREATHDRNIHEACKAEARLHTRQPSGELYGLSSKGQAKERELCAPFSEGKEDIRLIYQDSEW